MTNARPGQLADRLEIPGENIERFIRLNADLLAAREYEAITRYYGICDQKTATLDEIGNDWHVTRERPRQLRNRGLQILRWVATASGADVPEDPRQRTIDQFFNPRRAATARVLRRLNPIVNALNNEYGGKGLVGSVIAGGRRRMMRVPNIGRKGCDAIAAMLATEQLPFPNKETN